MTHSPNTSRRAFLKAGAVAGVGLLAGPGLIGGALASGVTRLRVGLTPPATQVIMGFRTENAGTGPLQPMFEFLTATDRFTGEVLPNLAQSWEANADATEWRFHLRDDVTFHNGTPFTAQDVRLSWELLTSEDSRATTARQFRDLIAGADDIEIVGDHEIVFHLAMPEPELPYYLTQGFLIYSKDYWDEVGENGYAAAPVGTGPFRFVEFREGEYILYSRVEDHWRQTPEFAELQLLYMPEDTTRLAALLGGEIHIAEIPRSVQNQAIARGKIIQPSTRSAAIVGGRFGGNYIDTGGREPGPLTNRLVREAMNIAINRDEINEQIFGGRGEIAIVDGFQRNDPQFNPEWQPYEFDPERARQLISEAGYPDGFAFDMTVVSPPGFPEIPTVVEAMAIYFSNIGLRPNLVQMEVAEQNNRQRSSDFYNTLYSNRQTNRPLFQVLNHFWSQSIYHFFEDPFIEERMEVFSVSTDPEERDAIIREIGDFLHEQHATLPLLYINAEVAVDPDVVAEYQADIGAFGASVGHEYTKAAG